MYVYGGHSFRLQIIFFHYRNLVSLLHAKGTTVYLVSGGFRSLIYPLAEYLGIPTRNVYANRLLFNEDGVCLAGVSACVGVYIILYPMHFKEICIGVCVYSGNVCMQLWNVKCCYLCYIQVNMLDLMNLNRLVVLEAKQKS